MFLFLKNIVIEKVFKNTNNIIFVFFKNSSYSLNLIFFKKKIGNQMCYSCFSYYHCLQEHKTIFINRNLTSSYILLSKNKNQTGPYILLSIFSFYIEYLRIFRCSSL